MECTPESKAGESAVVAHSSRSITMTPRDLSYNPNALSAVNCLPLDCLGQVFLYFVPEFDPERARGNKNLVQWQSDWTYLQRLALTCRLWKDAVYAFPSLWTHVAPQKVSHHTLARSLRRSGILPLDVAFQHTVSFEVLAILASEVGRIRALSFIFDEPFTEQILKGLMLFTSPAPKLQVLDFGSGNHISRETCWSWGTPRHQLPPLFQEGPDLPSLWWLQLEHLNGWSLGRFTELRYLVLKDSGAVEPARFDDVLAVLRANTRLEKVDLILSLPAHVNRVPADDGALVHLDSLLCLAVELTYDNATMRSLLSFISAPHASIHLELGWTDTTPLPDDLSHLELIFSPGHVAITLDDMSLEVEFDNGLFFLRIASDQAVDVMGDFLAELYPFDTEFLDMLDLHVDSADSRVDWRYLFVSTPLVCLSLHSRKEGICADFLEALCLKPDDVVPPCSGLQELTLDFADNVLPAAVIHMLTSRHAKGLSVPMLTIVRVQDKHAMQFTNEDIETMKGLVGELEME